MFKKIFISIAIMVVVLLPVDSFSDEDMVIDNDYYFDLDESESGVVVVYPIVKIKGLVYKVKIENAEYKQHYNLHGDEGRFALPEGDNNYRISMFMFYEKLDTFIVLYRKNFSIEGVSEDFTYLGKTHIVNWEDGYESIKYFSEIIPENLTTLNKVMAVHKYITDNITYDYDKAIEIDHYYVPNIEDVFSDNSGICSDFSALFASVMRSQGIPTRYMEGYGIYSNGTYHAWNEVLIDGEWMTVDLTASIHRRENNREYKLFEYKRDYIVKEIQ